jgi:DeoR/GlpR family transcriptional regulator of sugar metabolism
MSMIVQERHEAILRVLRRKPRIELPRLQRELRVSRSTLRRDLLELEHLGEVVRVRGGVVHAEFYKGEPTFERRRGRRVEEKRAIAVLAAGLVGENAAVYVDAGTTCLEVGRLLLKRADLRLFTHSIRLVADATDAEAPIVCVGGEYRRVSDALVGGLTASWLKQLRFDVAFVAASGLDADGCSTTEMTETIVKQEVLRRSARRILLADSEKWDCPSAVRFDDWSNIDDWVTDSGLPADARAAIRGKNVALHATRKE